MSGCSCDAEPADVVRHEVRRARKPHRCYECHAGIAPGERYEHTGIVHDGTARSHATCLGCVELREALAKVCDCWAFGDVWTCARDHLRDEHPHSATFYADGQVRMPESPLRVWADFGRLAGVWMRREEAPHG